MPPFTYFVILGTSWCNTKDTALVKRRYKWWQSRAGRLKIERLQIRWTYDLENLYEEAFQYRWPN